MCKHILYCADQSYLPYVFVSLRSLLVNNSDSNDYVVHFFVDNNDCETHPWFRKLQSEFTFKFYFYNLSRHKAISAVDHKGYYSPFACARLFLHEVLPADLRKILYLDVDTLVLDDISPLFQISLDRYVLAAVQDLSSPKRVSNRRELAIDEEFYINSGVMMINLDQWREYDTSHLWSDFTQQDAIKRHSRMMDQDFINKVFKTKIKTLSPVYNAFTLVKPVYEARGYTVFNNDYYPEFKTTFRLEQKCVIRHFLGKYKPWQFKRILLSLKGDCFYTLRHLRLWYHYQRFFMSNKDKVHYYQCIILSLPCRLMASLFSALAMLLKRSFTAKAGDKISDASS